MNALSHIPPNGDDRYFYSVITVILRSLVIAHEEPTYPAVSVLKILQNRLKRLDVRK